MKQGLRIIDVNLNRVAEGIRVLEDFFRFSFSSGNMEILAGLRQLRHNVRSRAAPLTAGLLENRDVAADPGTILTRNSRMDARVGGEKLVLANFKRVQEGLRSLEETLKSIDHYDLAKGFESLRYLAYDLEKEGYCLLQAHFPVAAEGAKAGPGQRKFPETDIYCLTAEALSCGRSNITVVKEMIAAGIRIIQYREKDKSSSEKFRECLEIREMTRLERVTFIVNDDVALALMVGADGVHIGQSDYPVEAVRKIVGEEMIIGLSTHAPEEAQRAQAAGADYIGVGPIYSTRTKKDVCAPVGHAYLEYVVANISIPFVAIGGIKEDNLHEITGRGAPCIALVSDITGAVDIGQKIERIRARIGHTFRKNKR